MTPSPTVKPWLSKTILFNVAMGLLVALVPVLPGAQGVSDFMKANLASIGIVWSVLSILLRAVTHGRISLAD